MLNAFGAARQIVYPNELAKNERRMTARCCEVSLKRSNFTEAIV
jgi:hypothetical protein